MYQECTSNLPGFYCESDIQTILSVLNAENPAFKKMTWREMSLVLFDGKINHATLAAYANGRPIVNKKHRRLLLIKTDQRNRRSISLDDPESAALTILTARHPDGRLRATDDYIERLVDLLDYEKRVK